MSSSLVKEQKQRVVTSKEVGGGITMGVLEDGTAFVNASGIASLCGVARSTIITWAAGWRDGRRNTDLARLFRSKGIDAQQLHILTHDGQHAYPDYLVLVFLEHYAKDKANRTARSNLTKLAGHALREFIYKETNYRGDPAVAPVPAVDQWRHFHDRLRLVDVPPKHFCVFKETAYLVVHLIDAGMTVNENTVPDGSVGACWAKHWDDNNLAAQYGPHVKFDHNYPDYYPQAASNPQPVRAYPMTALGVFRLWLEEEYLPKKFLAYLGRKVNTGMLAEGTARNVLAAFNLPTAALPVAKKRTRLKELPKAVMSRARKLLTPGSGDGE